MSEPIGPEQVAPLPASEEVAAGTRVPSGAPEPGPPAPDRAAATDQANQAAATHATVATDRAPGADPSPASPTHADPRVDDALSRLAEIDQLPLAEQVEVFGDMHRRLAAVLADPDSQAQ
jgi:hypothetical protein